MGVADYTPMTGPLPGKQYEPSNSTDGHSFQQAWCSRCRRDACMNGTKHLDDCGEDDFCPVLGASYCGTAVEWRELDGGKTTCLAFVPMGQPLTTPRCERTADMFDQAGVR